MGWLEFLDRMGDRRHAAKLAQIAARRQGGGFSSREQLMAFCLLVIAASIVGLTPVIVTGLMGKTIQDALIANSDKTVTGFIGVLGTITGLIFRRSQSDDNATANAGKALDAIKAAQEAPAPPVKAPDAILQPGETAEAAPAGDGST